MSYEATNAFVNRRDWRSYVSALQSAAGYSRELLSEGAAQATNWLAGRLPLKEKLSAG